MSVIPGFAERLRGRLRPSGGPSRAFPALDAELGPYGHLLTGRVLNVGAGARSIDALVAGEVVNLDLPNGDDDEDRDVDIWAPIDAIPVPDGHFDSVVCNAVLEHVLDPERAMDELARVLRPGGVLYLAVPFLQPEHPGPEDSQRYTAAGLRALCERHDFEVTEISGCHSTESTVAWILYEWLRFESRLRVLVPGRVVYRWLERRGARSEFQVESLQSTFRAVCRRR